MKRNSQSGRILPIRKSGILIATLLLALNAYLTVAQDYEEVLNTDIELGMVLDELKSELEDYKLADENEGGLTYAGISFVNDYKFKPNTFVHLRNGIVFKVMIVGESLSGDINYLYARAYQDLKDELGKEKYSFGEDGRQSAGYRDPEADISKLMALGVMIDKSWKCYRYKVWNGANETDYSEYNNIQVVFASLKRNDTRYLYLSYEYMPDKVDFETLSTGEKKYTSHVNGQIVRVTCIHPNHETAYIENYKDGAIEGEVTRYYDDGSRQEKVFYVNGKKQGRETRWRKDGSLLQEDSYDHGVHVDSTIIYYDDGSIKEIKLYKDGETAFSHGYFKSGAKEYESPYEDGKKSGVETGWYESGKKAYEIKYAKGVKNGKVTNWYENGNLRLTSVNVNGKRNGLFTEYYENGQKKYSVMVVDGDSHGTQEGWYESGNKKYVTEFVNGEETGTQKVYYESGNLQWEAQVIDGVKDGDYSEWHENGNLKRKGEYFDGKVKNSCWEFYDEQGKLSVEKCYNQFGEVTYLRDIREEEKAKEWAFSSTQDAKTWLNNSVWVWDSGRGEKNYLAFTKGRVELAKTVNGSMVSSYKMHYKVVRVSINDIILRVTDDRGFGGEDSYKRVGKGKMQTSGVIYTKQ